MLLSIEIAEMVQDGFFLFILKKLKNIFYLEEIPTNPTLRLLVGIAVWDQVG